ncbi:hypothetical protein G6662_05910 [Polynucleobacter paneuropaeus]|nr:hypothetical protein [Polynucleobacter paneuropaeus]
MSGAYAFRDSILIAIPGLVIGLNKVLLKFLKMSVDENYYSWIRQYYFPQHKYIIFSYLVGLSIFYILCFIKIDSVKSKNINLYTYIISVIFSLVSILSNNPYLILMLMIIWIIFLGSYFYKKISIQESLSNILNKLSIAIIILVSILFINNIFIFINNNYVIYNNNIEIIPSYLKDSNGNYLNSQKFINDNNLYLNNAYSIDSTINLSECQPGFDLGKIEFNKENEFKAHDSRFFINKKTNHLCVGSRLYLVDFNYLNSRYGLSKSDLNVVLEKNNYLFDNTKELNNEVIKIASNLTFEFTQSLDQFEDIFHHHFQFLGPINEYSLGKPLEKIQSLYGLSFLPYFYVMKYITGISYENFISLIFITYILYFLILLFVVKVVFKDVIAIAIMALVFSGAIFSLGYITLFTGLGYSPARYFPHLILIYTLYKYQNNERIIYLCFSILIGLAGILIDTTFGIFSYAAFIGALIITTSKNNFKTRENLLILLSIVLGLLTIFYSKTIIGKSPYVSGFLDGIWGFDIESKKLLLLVLIFTIFNYLIIKGINNGMRDVKIPLFLLLYSELISIYWLIFPNYGHLAIIITPIAMMIISFIILFKNKFINYIYLFLIFSSIIFYSINFINYNSSKSKYNTFLNNNKIFNFDFDRANFNSTMDPIYFNEAVILINKYSHSNEIYIISLYDNFLTWISGKYSLMPSENMISFLNNKIAFTKSVDYLNSRKPEYIFVDTSVNFESRKLYPFKWDNIPIDGSYQGRALEKAERIDVLNSLFFSISPDYELLEKGKLISVYRRKTNHH